MIQIDAIELQPRDIGKRVIVTHEGQAVAGRLTKISAYGYAARGAMGNRKPHALSRLNFSIVLESTGMEIDYSGVPLDYAIQIDSPDATPMDSGKES